MGLLIEVVVMAAVPVAAAATVGVKVLLQVTGLVWLGGIVGRRVLLQVEELHLSGCPCPCLFPLRDAIIQFHIAMSRPCRTTCKRTLV